MLDFLTLFNFFLLAFTGTLILSYYHSFRKYRWLWVILIISFVATSTKILPARLAASYESQIPILYLNSLDKDKTEKQLQVNEAMKVLDTRKAEL